MTIIAIICLALLTGVAAAEVATAWGLDGVAGGSVDRCRRAGPSGSAQAVRVRADVSLERVPA